MNEESFSVTLLMNMNRKEDVSTVENFTEILFVRIEAKYTMNRARELHVQLAQNNQSD